jgi:Tfp pilus assembly protein PilF
VPVLERATAADPRNAEAWGGLAFAHSRLHQDAAALQALDARVRLAPETPETLFLRATSCDSLHQSRAAADGYRRFLAAAAGRYPSEEWQARQRLAAFGRR